MTPLLAAIPAEESTRGVYQAASGTLQTGSWLLVALPALGAAVLLLGGRRTDRWGHWLAVALSWAAFVWAALLFIDLLGLDAGQRRPRPAPVRLDPGGVVPARARGCCSTRCP